MALKPRKTNRNRAYYRHHRKRVINRKRSIINQTYLHVVDDQFGRLSKGKIHCSCGMCSYKTRFIGFPKSEKSQIENQKQQFKEAKHNNYYA